MGASAVECAARPAGAGASSAGARQGRQGRQGRLARQDDAEHAGRGDRASWRVLARRRTAAAAGTPGAPGGGMGCERVGPFLAPMPPKGGARPLQRRRRYRKSMGASAVECAARPAGAGASSAGARQGRQGRQGRLARQDDAEHAGRGDRASWRVLARRRTAAAAGTPGAPGGGMGCERAGPFLAPMRRGPDGGRTSNVRRSPHIGRAGYRPPPIAPIGPVSAPRARFLVNPTAPSAPGRTISGRPIPRLPPRRDGARRRDVGGPGARCGRRRRRRGLSDRLSDRANRQSAGRETGNPAAPGAAV